VQYSKAFGKTSMRPGHAKPFQLDTIMWIASFTKLMTSICTMQLVEQGHVTLDESIYKHIPELESLPLITSIDENTGKPVEEKNTTPITLRHLLTHTSGLTYDMLHPLTIAWLKHHGRSTNMSGKLLERYSAPLVFTPGTGWCYGPSVDFAGLLVERISGKTLQAYMEEHLWGPLGIKDATFHPSSRTDLKARLADQSTRTPDGKLAHHGAQMPWADGQGKEVEDCLGGQGCFSTAEEYLKIVHAVLTSDEDEKVLKKATVEEFFKPQLGEGSRAALNGLLQIEMVSLYHVCATFANTRRPGQQHHGWHS
jgi:CubicO group peptidase (beta-lactamase class C family)